ncbi:metalloprotease [Candidatus Woesearchaeota archaeon]|nr:metalloprotease [Candidatus Woesearchaeota archaeon]
MPPNQLKIGNISTSEAEIKDIIKAWAAISIAFAIVLSKPVFSPDFYGKFVIASLTVGIGFLFHEMGHKIVAQRYGCFAEFRSFDNMLILAVAMSFFGFIFAAPGAVMIKGRISKTRSGRISAAGPVVNIALSMLFLALVFIQLPNSLKPLAYYGFLINSWLALFNMIPFWLFDGYKILKWSKTAYGSIAAVALALMLLQGFIPPI